MNVIAATDKHLALMGRTAANPDGSLSLSYPGVTLLMDVVADKVRLDAHSTSNQTYLEVIVDQRESRLIKLSTQPQSYGLLDEQSPGRHRIRLINRSETWHGVTTLQRLGVHGQLLPAPELPTRKILVLGDSVTCGEVIDRVVGKTKDTSWSNPRLSYGMLSAAALQAQVQLVCYGGRGLVRSWNGKTDEFNLPDFYQMAIPDAQQPRAWEQANYQPDLIISAIGTNDFSQGIPDREPYITTYVKLLLQLLSDHPKAQIALTEGAILHGEKKEALVEYLQEIRKRTADKRVHLLKTSHFPGDVTDAHPTKQQHADMAAELVPQLKAIMHW